MPIYQQIGKSYDRTRRADPYLVSRLAYHLQIQPHAVYLDAACGTGNYAVTLAEQGGRWHAIDHSSLMVNFGRQKSSKIQWQVADVVNLPYADKTFAGAICTLAVHHFDSLAIAFQEIYRVLETGRFVLFTSTPEQIRRYWLAEYFPNAIEASARQMPKLQAVVDALKNAGFHTITTEPYQVQPDLQDLFLYSGKHHPEIYLDAQIRAGISTFAMLAKTDEIEEGCQRLAADIATGEVASIIQRYDHDRGDYLFVVAGKH